MLKVAFESIPTLFFLKGGGGAINEWPNLLANLETSLIHKKSVV